MKCHWKVEHYIQWWNACKISSAIGALSERECWLAVQITCNTWRHTVWPIESHIHVLSVCISIMQKSLHLCTTIMITNWFYKYLVKYEIYYEVEVIIPSKILKKFIIEVCVLIIELISVVLLIIFCPISVLVLMYRHLRSN